MDDATRLLVDEQDQRVLAHERTTREELTLKLERLEKLTREQERIADEMERLAEQSRNLRAESTELLAA